mmetsp:Transcript_14552/g.22760  ORF Transcript_14552/g.22760 Transcript_14552/m.22760 type:complete len:395 (-) Transcript_14552:497-1681(-)|eukprot:CAMPEP_0195300006 /NCGR_PEP_ID=MMETSP0707-20130614/26574_1 /TAXON_ID=33640 /ORGANISM="Asterionellopsis glacialis, Strain CCMP134" /LENGTH=394 /DNA_ID=CAMNT_0040362559 /DNA_START=69 /DNA_END=1253 /DNA_ORIENTATION=+
MSARPRRTRNLDGKLTAHLSWWEGASTARAYQGPALSTKEADARQINRLPSRATSFYEGFEFFGWGPTLRELLVGTRDESSELQKLRGHEDTLLRHIFSYVAAEWGQHVTLTIPASCVGRLAIAGDKKGMCRFNRGREDPVWQERELVDSLPIVSSSSDMLDESEIKGFVSFAVCGKIEFPVPADRNVNMLPFIFGNKESLPQDLQCYYDCIENCPYLQEEIGKVGYLTIHECYVDTGKAQRREGLHIETPGAFTDKSSSIFSPGREHRWGLGMFYEPDMYDGGIYMASNVSNTSEIFDALVDKEVDGIVDRHGGCEHLRGLIGPGTKLEANELVWMTDCTPHQALPQDTSGYRQFFRVVTSNVSHWFADHSTPNPKVPVPDEVIVVDGNKFEM